MKRKMPTLNALKAFEVAGRTGSFTRAAEQLNVTQSAVSRQVRQLEAQLGEPLLNRQHHHLELSEAGRRLLQALQQSFDRIELTVRAIQEKTHRNRLRVNAPPTFTARWLMPRLARLRDAHPELELSLSTRLEDGLADSGTLDCAIRFGDGEWDGFDNRHLITERHVAVCAPALLARHGHAGHADYDGGRAANLREFTLLHVLANTDQRYLTWQHWLKAAGIDDVDTSGGYEFDLLDHAISAAVDGLGVTIADRHMIARELATGALVPVLDVHVDGHESYWLVTRAQRETPPQVDTFRAWLHDEIWLDARAAAPSSAAGGDGTPAASP